MGISPIALAHKMKTKSVSTRGVQVLTHFLPTLGSTMESRTYSTTASRAFMKPEGMGRSCFRYLRMVHVATRKTNVATSHSISTCFVTEKSMPPIVGRWMSGCSCELFDTCSMMVLPASNFSAWPASWAAGS